LGVLEQKTWHRGPCTSNIPDFYMTRNNHLASFIVLQKRKNL
jgi:hypothetical protein